MQSYKTFYEPAATSLIVPHQPVMLALQTGSHGNGADFDHTAVPAGVEVLFGGGHSVRCGLAQWSLQTALLQAGPLAAVLPGGWRDGIDHLVERPDRAHGAAGAIYGRHVGGA